MATQFTAFFMSIVLLIGNLFAMLVPDAGEAKTVEELESYGYILEQKTTADEIYAIEAGNIADNELDTVICLQGLVNKNEPKLYIIYDDVNLEYLLDYEQNGKKIIYENTNGQKWTLALLIEEFRDCITDGGYTLYRESEFAEGLNVACNYATVYGWLAFPVELKDFAESCGLTLKMDFSEDTYNYLFQLRHFNKLKENFADTAVVHVKTEKKGLRDLAIQQNFWIGYSETNTFGESFMATILSYFGDNTAVLGWGETEIHFVEFLSKHKSFVIPTDHSKNNSYIANFKYGNIEQAHETTEITADETKHYVALCFSDGDNSQWIQNGYKEYFQKLALDYDFPMTWSFPEIQQELSPASVKRVYSASNQNNYFVGSITGIGYSHITEYPVSALSEYADMTAAALLRSDTRILSFLDELPSDVMLPTFLKKLSYFTRYDNVDGAILLLDPNGYSSGAGKVWFSNDKPLVSVRYSLWYPGDEGCDVPAEWLEERAEQINSMEANIYSTEGYSLINIHPWTISIESLAYFVSQLDEHIELVTVDELINLISENCPHE